MWKHKTCLLLQVEFRKKNNEADWNPWLFHPQGKTSADTPFPCPLECCMGKKNGSSSNTLLQVKLWLTRREEAVAAHPREQNMRTTVTKWGKGSSSLRVGGKKQGARTVNGRGGITLSFTLGSPSSHSTTYMALGSHRLASQLMSFGLDDDDSGSVWVTTCGNLH